MAAGGSTDEDRGYKVQSVFAADDAEVHDVPMSVIRRPIPSVLDEDKVRGGVCRIA